MQMLTSLRGVAYLSAIADRFCKYAHKKHIYWDHLSQIIWHRGPASACTYVHVNLHEFYNS